MCERCVKAGEILQGAIDQILQELPGLRENGDPLVHHAGVALAVATGHVLLEEYVGDEYGALDAFLRCYRTIVKNKRQDAANAANPDAIRHIHREPTRKQ